MIHLCLLLLLHFQLMGQEQWKLVKEKEGIQVYTRTNTVSSFKEFKAMMQIEGEVNQFLAVLYDIESPDPLKGIAY